MANWFKFYDDFFDDNRIKWVVSKNPHAATVYTYLLCKTIGGKHAFPMFPRWPSIMGVSKILNLDRQDVEISLELLSSVELIKESNEIIFVEHWHKERPRYIPKRIKLEVIQRMGAGCVFCGSKERIEFDHVVPVVHGGPTTVENLQPLCKPCNLRKGAK